MTTFTTQSHRETFTPSELMSLVQDQGIRLATAYAKSTGNVKFGQLSRGLVLVKMAEWPYWLSFSVGETPITKGDVMDFMLELFPQTALENVTTSINPA